MDYCLSNYIQQLSDTLPLVQLFNIMILISPIVRTPNDSGILSGVGKSALVPTVNMTLFSRLTPIVSYLMV